MICAWKELLAILPQWMRQETDRVGRDNLQEVRLRSQAPPELITGTGSVWLSRNVTSQDIQYTINASSRYSPWAAETVSLGYITAPGGHRIGICGDAVVQNGIVTGIGKITSLCIRVARDFPGIGDSVPVTDSLLILGAPGWGKTTLLRDVARNIAKRETICVVDEREELFPPGIPRGKRMDVLSQCPKPQALDRLLRTMGPSWIAVDEITAEGDCEALIQADRCGVKLIATAHGTCRTDLQKRPIYRKLTEAGLFRHLILLDCHKKPHYERMEP